MGIERLSVCLTGCLATATVRGVVDLAVRTAGLATVDLAAVRAATQTHLTEVQVARVAVVLAGGTDVGQRALEFAHGPAQVIFDLHDPVKVGAVLRERFPSLTHLDESRRQKGGDLIDVLRRFGDRVGFHDFLFRDLLFAGGDVPATGAVAHVHAVVDVGHTAPVTADFGVRFGDRPTVGNRVVDERDLGHHGAEGLERLVRHEGDFVVTLDSEPNHLDQLSLAERADTLEAHVPGNALEELDRVAGEVVVHVVLRTRWVAVEDDSSLGA